MGRKGSGMTKRQAQLFTDAPWVEVKDGNDTARTIFDQHYSRYTYADGRKPKLFIGPGQKLVLITPDASSLCAWRKFISRDAQEGVNCAIFRHEGSGRASDLLRSAMGIAWRRWPGERLYTYVDPRGVKPTWRAGRPTWGHCFYEAGWCFAGLTKGGLHVLAHQGMCAP